MMRHPAPAIDAFETYLREAPTLDVAERTEIEGYIAEMRRLELSAPPPASSGATAPSPQSANAPTTVTAASSSREGGSSIVRKWWFWAGIGALVAAGIIVIASSGEDRLPCPSGAVCP
jgi:hypothetical protein